MNGENNFAEISKIELDTDLKITILCHQNNYVGRMMSNAAQSFDIATKRRT